MYRHEFRKKRTPTLEEWACIESIAHWVVENAPETVASASNALQDLDLRDALATEVEFFDPERGTYFGDEVSLEHEPSNVVQTHLGTPAIQMNGIFEFAADNFILTNSNPERDNCYGLGVCNTERHPYDLLICAMLALIDHQIPGLLAISSDGGPDEWADAINYAAGYDSSVSVPAGVYTSHRARQALPLPPHLDCRA